MSKRLIVSASMAALLFFGAACGDSEGDDNNDADSAENGEQENGDSGEDGEQGGEEGPDGQPEAQQPPEPDLEGIPDVVAEVNGEEIPRDEFVPTYEAEFQQMAMQAQQTGEDVDEDELKQQTAQGLVDQELLRQEAGERGFDASEEDINQELNDLAEQNGLESSDQFLQTLEEQGMPEDEVMSQVEIQVIIGQLLTDETGDTEPTEEELRELYKQSEEQQQQMGDQAGEMPPFEEAKPQLEEQAQAENESAAAESLAGDLREDGQVDIFL